MIEYYIVKLVLNNTDNKHSDLNALNNEYNLIKNEF